MIPFVYGWKRWPEAKWSVLTDCPACSTETILSGIQIKRNITLYMIPIMRFWSDWTVGCPDCGMVWKLTRSKWQQAERELGGRQSVIKVSFDGIMAHLNRQSAF